MNYSSMSDEALRAECLTRGLPVEGDSSELRARLQADDASGDPSRPEGMPSTIDGPEIQLGVDGLGPVTPNNPPPKSAGRSM
jgi:hypothetical protein